MISMMVVNALGYALPAIFVGFFVSVLAIRWVNNMINNIDGGFSINFEEKNFIISVLIALVIPILSVIKPVLGLLQQNISFALDKDHMKTSSLKISVINTKKRFPWESFSLALNSTVIGLLIYIFLPMSLLSFNISLFVIIFFGLLLAMLFSVMMLLTNFSYILEFVLLIPLYFERKFIRTMVRMNLIAHRIKNRRTVIIYALSLSFINFIYVILLMSIEASQVYELRTHGSELVLHLGEEETINKEMTVGKYLEIIQEAGVKDLIDYSIRLERLDYFFIKNGVGNYTV